MLLKQLTKELGSLTKAAKRLGITQATASFIRNGDREAGGESIQKAITALGLDSAFFYAAPLGSEPDYRDHLAGGSASRIDRSEDLPPAFAAFYASVGADTTAEEKERLQDRRWREGLQVTLEDLLAFRMMIRNAKARGLPPLTEEEQELERRRIAKGRPRNVLVGAPAISPNPVEAPERKAAPSKSRSKRVTRR